MSVSGSANYTVGVNSAEMAAAISLALVGGSRFKGYQSCVGNPNYPAAVQGDFYIVSVAGKIGGAAGTDVEVGDAYGATADNAGGTQAAVGSSWNIAQGNTQVDTDASHIAPVGVQSAGSIGKLADSGHVHAHGTQAGGSLHADAIAAGASGFLTGADKTKLDATSGTNTGDQTITLTGDVTGSGGGSFAATIAAQAVTVAKMFASATARFLGRVTAGAGAVEELTAAQMKTALAYYTSGDTFVGNLTGNASGSSGSCTGNAATATTLVGDVAWTTFSPTVTLVTGAGNTVPQYSTNTGRYAVRGGVVYVEVYLTGDGGNEGAGTGIMNVALPVTSNAATPTGRFPCGYSLNSAIERLLFGQLGVTGSATTIGLSYLATDLAGSGTTAVLTGADQNNTIRTIRLQFFYDA